MPRIPRPVGLALAFLLLVPPASAQEREIEEAGLPRATVDRLLAIVNDPATVTLPGDSHIATDSVLPGDVVVMGDLRLAGRIEGDLILVHGNLEIEPGSVVSGDLTVVDGAVRGAEEAAIGGTLIAYQRHSRFVQRGERGRHVASGSRPFPREVPSGSRLRFQLGAGEYNRVEGLPVHVGPVLDTGGRAPFRAEANLTWRTEGQAPFAADRVGYLARVEQFLGGRRALRVGAAVLSTIQPIESRGLSDRENAWSTFLLTSDHRDYFERRGWSAFVRGTPRPWPIDASLEFRRERHGSLGAADPWSLFDSGRIWRPQPLVAEGAVESVVAGLDVDSRDDHEEPFDGWLVRAEWQQGVGGTLALPVAVPGAGETSAPGPAPAPTFDGSFSTGLLDVRRYHPVGRGGGLAMRGMLAGSPDGGVLPPQYQHVLGGPGSLPGHRRFAGDCGARASQVHLERAGHEGTMFPFYGCDRVALAQVEYRGPLDFHFGFGPPGEGRVDPSRRHRGPRWAVFFNAGRGWAAGEWTGLTRRDSGALYDAGLGLLFGRSGVYWSVPLGEGVRGSTLTVRLDRRF